MIKEYSKYLIKEQQSKNNLLNDYLDSEGDWSEENKNDNKLQNLEKLSELSSLWEEDEKTQQQINNIIDDAEKSSQWGSIGSRMN